MTSGAWGQQWPAPELTAPVPGDPQSQCEDENGNTWNLPLEQYQSGMRPQGPCLPVGSWDRMRDRADPDRRRRRQEQIDRDLSAVGPETKRVVACQRCVDSGECTGVEKLRCIDLPFVAERCDRCGNGTRCTVDRRIGCGTRRRAGWEPGGALLTYRRTVVTTVQRYWSRPRTQPALSAKVEFTIAGDGTISNISLTQSSRDDAFDRSVTDAVKATGHLPRPPPGWPPSFLLEFHSTDTESAG